MRLLAVNATGVVGGAEVVLGRLVDAAAERGWDARVLVPEGDFFEHERAEGVTSSAIPDLKLPAGPRLLAALRMVSRWFRASRHIRSAMRDCDVVLVNGVLALPAVWLARGRPSKVWLVHDVIDRRDWQLLVRATRRCVAIAIAPSRAVARSLEVLGVPATVVPQGTPWPVAPAPAGPASPPVVGLVGALTPLKGQDVLLEALAELGHRDMTIELVGAPLPKDADYAQRLQDRAARPDLAGRVRFVGRVDDALDYVRGWAVAVSASVEPEAAPLAVLEAMSVGVPVVATAHGASPEFLDGAGLLVPPRDARALAAAIERLFDDSELRARAAVSGPRTIEREHVLERSLDVLMRIVRSHARPGRRITIVVPDYAPRLGGTNRQAATFAAGFQRRGHRVDVVTRRREPGLRRHELVDGVRVTRVGPRRSGRWSDKGGVAAVVLRLATHRPDAVCVIMYPDFAVAAGLAGLSHRTLMCWAGTGDATDTIGPAHGVVHRALGAVRRHMLANGRSVALTRAMGRELAGLGVDAEVLPLPLDLSRFRPPTPAERAQERERLRLGDDELVIEYVGQLRRLKAVDRLVDAVAMLVPRFPQTRLLIIGGSGATPDRCDDELRGQVRALGLESHVVFTGDVSDVEQYLWAADAFGFPSTREGMPFALVEAMACGLACVAPALPVGDEVLGDAGMVTVDSAPASLAAALELLAADPALRECLGAAAVEAAHAWDADRVLDEYEQVLITKSASP